MKVGVDVFQTTGAHANIDAFYGPYESKEQAILKVISRYRKQGLTVGVIENGKVIEYQWAEGIEDNQLVKKSQTNSIPVLTEQMAREQNIQEPYISIPDESDLDVEVENHTYQTQENGQLANILFSALRQLQAEVARLKNSFAYGITSYKDGNTAFSSVLSDYEDVESEEPLWAIDPEALSLVDQIEIGQNHGISGRVQVEKTKLNILETGTWQSKTVTDVQDPKIIFYVTLSNPNIIFNFNNNIDEETTNYISLNLQQLCQDVSPQRIMVILSRKQNDKGSNYIYVTSDNLNTDINIIKGYYNFSTGQLQNSKYTFEGGISFNQIILNQTSLLSMSVYSKYQDFSQEVIPSKPNSEYKYEAAHISIRSVKTLQTLKDNVRFLEEDELIYCKENKSLYIIDNGQIQIIGTKSTNPEDDTDNMSDAQILNKLESLGILYNDVNKTLRLNDVSDITFVNDDTKVKYNFKVDAYGNLTGKEILDEDKTLAKKIEGQTFPDKDVRGFVAAVANLKDKKPVNQDFKANSDRVKIAAIYAPNNDDIIHGCTHGYIELENTSEQDFPLDGCYIHCARTNELGENMEVKHLALDGYIPAGGTYLIRCKQYAYESDPNSYIKVNTFDKEWYVSNELNEEQKELLDLTVYSNTKLGFALTYGMENLQSTDILVEVIETPINPTYTTVGLNTSEFPYSIKHGYIDGIYINAAYTDTSSNGYWAANSVFKKTSNCIYKNIFELDPAKQAFQAFTTKDSSRVRWGKATDYQYLTLNEEFIQFPNSDEKYPISKFTPKASFEYKNVCTDKTKLDLNKPNMVTCSFGINIYTTRCFNWISAGRYNEYVFIKNFNGKDWQRIASFGQSDNSGFRKTFDENTLNVVYNRISGRFPADNTFYTSHKCIINVENQPVDNPTTYTYVVGRSDKNGNPDIEHCSEEYTFTLYPTSYIPRIYQVTDQQGFHWIEYQVWAATAKLLNNKIQSEQSLADIIPILINTGDMTQNGTRINEWLDYYNAGKCLFDHLEQMNVVGNNDLCGTNVDKLGTGDDPGKSNSFYFHLFYCYEISEDLNKIPIINDKYIPSLYYFDSKDTRYLMVNSEIKDTNCSGWFGLKSGDITVNIYTGYSVPSSGTQQYMAGTLNFNPIYSQIYTICNEVRGSNVQNKKQIVGVCHELPFTVITTESIGTGNAGTKSIKSIYRSISNDNKLVGSHLNQLNPQDEKGIYWFSRLMEHFGVKLVIGGHKHTYACTYPLRENYYYKDQNNLWKNSENGPMEMGPTLENDEISFMNPNDSSDTKNLTKFPLTKRTNVEDTQGIIDVFLPHTAVPNLTGGVIYFMCQASGYKLTSNKELPTKLQTFSQIIPETTYSNGNSSAHKNQKYPMFSIISQNNDQFNIKLIRVKNILDSSSKFTQADYSKEKPKFEYLSKVQGNDYGSWGETETNLIENI